MNFLAAKRITWIFLSIFNSVKTQQIFADVRMGLNSLHPPLNSMSSNIEMKVNSKMSLTFTQMKPYWAGYKYQNLPIVLYRHGNGAKGANIVQSLQCSSYTYLLDIPKFPNWFTWYYSMTQDDSKQPRKTQVPRTDSIKIVLSLNAGLHPWHNVSRFQIKLAIQNSWLSGCVAKPISITTVFKCFNKSWDLLKWKVEESGPQLFFNLGFE